MTFRLGFLFALLLLRLTPLAAEPSEQVLRAERERIEVMKNASEATVAIFAPGGKGGGSGVLISADGYALTNYHVTEVGPALECGLNDGKVYDAVIVGLDPTGDVSMIKLLGRNDFPHAPLGDSDRVRVGDWVFAAGNPFLLAEDFQPSISYGIVSGTQRYQYPSGTLLEYADCIQTDAAINPGNSGGPLFNSKGELIGINGRGSFEKRGRVNVGVGYAISINQIKKFMGHLKSGRIADHAALGATMTTDADGKVIVNDVLENSDAARYGLSYGDELVYFGDRSIRTVNAFKNSEGTFPKGWRVPMTFRRDGKTMECFVKLRGAHREDELLDLLKKQKSPPAPPRPKIPNSLLPAKKPGLPEIVQKHYVKKSGYLNYYFNEQHQKRIWDAYSQISNLIGSDTNWKIEGDLVGEGKFTLVLSPTNASLEHPKGKYLASFENKDDLQKRLDPPGSGGMFSALHIWQRFLTVGPEKFGQITYLGTAPLQKPDQLMDVIVGTYAGMEIWFYFDQDSHELVCVELIPEEDASSCMIFLKDYQGKEGEKLPRTFEVHHQDQLYGTFKIDEFVRTK